MTHPVPRRSPPRQALRDDRGAVAVEFALAVPMLVLILVTVAQVFTWGMGYLAAHAAADHAVQTARVVGGSQRAGQTDAEQLLTQLGGRFVNNPRIAVTRGAATTTVTIHGTAHGMPLPITVAIDAPTERYTR